LRIISHAALASVGREIKQEVLRSRHEAVVAALYFDFPRQCATCGRRFADQEEYGRHLDGHFLKRKRLKQQKAQSRMWYVSTRDWLSESTSSAAASGAVPGASGAATEAGGMGGGAGEGAGGMGSTREGEGGGGGGGGAASSGGAAAAESKLMPGVAVSSAAAGGAADRGGMGIERGDGGVGGGREGGGGIGGGEGGVVGVSEAGGGVGDQGGASLAVPAEEEADDWCALCGEKFAVFFDPEEDEWMYRGAVVEGVAGGVVAAAGRTGEGVGEGRRPRIVHATCREASTSRGSSDSSRSKRLRVE
ncbi:hypothetical protein CLOM_g13306, partial [Closterium sp. NIES-68]